MILDTEHTFYDADDIAIRQIVVPYKGMRVLQHSHAYDHITLLTNGAVRLFVEGEDAGVIAAPKPITIRAGTKHTFEALEDNTVLYCIHNVMRTGKIDVLELNGGE